MTAFIVKLFFILLSKEEGVTKENCYVEVSKELFKKEKPKFLF